MKYIPLAFIVLLYFISNKIYAQSSGIDEGSLTNIKAPSSPASTIIDNQPSAISRPKSWESLEASVFSNFYDSNNNLLIPNDFALEFSPYWAGDRNTLSPLEFMNPDIGLTALQNLSFSVSSTQNFIINDSIHTNALGFGIRTMIWQGTRKEIEDIHLLLNKIDTGLNMAVRIGKLVMESTNECGNGCDKKKFIQILITKIKKDTLKLNGKDISIGVGEIWLSHLEKELNKNLGDDVSKYDVIVDDVVEKMNKIDTTVNILTELRKDRKGFKLEVAGAFSLNFPTNEIDFSMLPKLGFWLTPSWQPYKTDWFEALGVLRFFHYYKNFYVKYFPEQETYDNTVDYGVRIVFKKSKFSIEGEIVGRRSKTILSQITDSITNVTTTAKKTDDDFQWLLNFNYQISEKLSLSYNFGKQFNPVLNYSGNLVSLATLNFGLGAPKKKDIKNE